MSSLQVVYVEDNYPSLLLITRHLENAGYIVHGADNGTRGLALIRKIHPDVILLDINLPDINGNDIAQQIREDTTFWQIPLIAVTASFYEVHHRDASPFDAYIAKPVRHRELLDTIDKLRVQLSTS